MFKNNGNIDSFCPRPYQAPESLAGRHKAPRRQQFSPAAELACLRTSDRASSHLHHQQQQQKQNPHEKLANSTSAKGIVNKPCIPHEVTIPTFSHATHASTTCTMRMQDPHNSQPFAPSLLASPTTQHNGHSITSLRASPRNMRDQMHKNLVAGTVDQNIRNGPGRAGKGVCGVVICNMSAEHVEPS